MVQNIILYCLLGPISLLLATTNSLFAQGTESKAAAEQGFSISTLLGIAPIAALLGLIFAYFFYRKMIKADEGNDVMREIAQHVRDGAGGLS